MKEELLNLLNSIFPLSDELETELSFYLKFEQFPKKAHLLKEGQILEVPVKLTMSCRSKLTTYFAGEDL